MVMKSKANASPFSLTNDSSVAFATNLLTWTKQLTLLTDNHEVSTSDRANLADFDIPVRTDTVVGLEGDTSTRQLRRVVFADGEPLECDALFFNLGTELATDFHEKLAVASMTSRV